MRYSILLDIIIFPSTQPGYTIATLIAICKDSNQKNIEYLHRIEQVRSSLTALERL